MLNISAKAGEASNLSSLSEEALNILNVRGKGHIHIDQVGESACMKWIPKEEFNPVLPYPPSVVSGGSGGITVRLTGPVQFVQELMDLWRLDIRDAVGLLGYDSEDLNYVSEILAGRRQLRGRDVRDRISHLFIVRRTLWSLFRDIDVENDWLREEHSTLNGKQPMSLIVRGSMEDLLLAREYVESAAGVR